MWTNEIGCDVKLIVGEDQESVFAHSYVLTSRSCKFADILAEQRRLADKLIPIPDVAPDILRLLLR
jgi:hypothetical protein